MKVGVATRFKSLWFGVKGYDWWMKTYQSINRFDRSVAAQFRLEAINFSSRFGVKPTLSAYKVSKATLYRWKKTFKASQGRLVSLAPLSTKPKKLRERLVDLKLISFIKNLRETYGQFGKDKLKPLLDEYCQRENLKPISASTIGRVIKDHHLFYQRSGKVYHNPNHGWARPRLKKKRLRVRYAPKPQEFGHIQMDSITKLVDGLKVYLVTAIDIKLKFSFCLPYTSLNAKNALDCFKKLELVYPFAVKSVQTDNGLEFLGVFDDYLTKRHLLHYFIYPRCPRINGVVERFNRTLKENFLNQNLYLIHNQPELFHDKLVEFLLFFNTKRPHQTLGQRSPLGYALEKGYLSQMCWTSTTH